MSGLIVGLIVAGLVLVVVGLIFGSDKWSRSVVVLLGLGFSSLIAAIIVGRLL